MNEYNVEMWHIWQCPINTNMTSRVMILICINVWLPLTRHNTTFIQIIKLINHKQQKELGIVSEYISIVNESV